MLSVAPREGRVSRNFDGWMAGGMECAVAPREGRVSRNIEAEGYNCKIIVAPREGRVSRNDGQDRKNGV